MTSFVIADQGGYILIGDWLGRIGQLLNRAVRHVAAKTFEAIGGFTARDGLVGRYGPCAWHCINDVIATRDFSTSVPK